MGIMITYACMICTRTWVYIVHRSALYMAKYSDSPKNIYCECTMCQAVFWALLTLGWAKGLLDQQMI